MNRQKQLDRLGLGPARPILTSSAAPILLRGRGRAQPASLPMQLRGQRPEEASHPLCPASTQQPSSCHVWRTPAAESPTEQEPEAPISPQLPCHGREFREQQRLAGYLSLATLGGEQQPIRLTHQAELRSCISLAFGTFTIPQKMTIFRQNIYLQCLAPGEEKLWWHPGQSHPPPLAVLVFLPSARTKWLPARPLLLTKCPPW